MRDDDGAHRLHQCLLVVRHIGGRPYGRRQRAPPRDEHHAVSNLEFQVGVLGNNLQGVEHADAAQGQGNAGHLQATLRHFRKCVIEPGKITTKIGIERVTKIEHRRMLRLGRAHLRHAFLRGFRLTEGLEMDVRRGGVIVVIARVQRVFQRPREQGNVDVSASIGRVFHRVLRQGISTGFDRGLGCAFERGGERHEKEADQTAIRVNAARGVV